MECREHIPLPVGMRRWRGSAARGKSALQRIDQPKLGCGGFGFRHDSVRRIGGDSPGGKSSGVIGSAKSYGSTALETGCAAPVSLVGKEVSSAAMTQPQLNNQS